MSRRSLTLMALSREDFPKVGYATVQAFNLRVELRVEPLETPVVLRVMVLEVAPESSDDFNANAEGQ